MHDLLRRYARDRAAAGPGSDQAVERLLDYYQHTAARAEDRLARQTRPGPPPATPAALPLPRPWKTPARRWRGRAPNAPACSPASTTPPPPASTPG